MRGGGDLDQHRRFNIWLSIILEREWTGGTFENSKIKKSLRDLQDTEFQNARAPQMLRYSYWKISKWKIHLKEHLLGYFRITDTDSESIPKREASHTQVTGIKEMPDFLILTIRIERNIKAIPRGKGFQPGIWHLPEVLVQCEHGMKHLQIQSQNISLFSACFPNLILLWRRKGPWDRGCSTGNQKCKAISRR